MNYNTINSSYDFRIFLHRIIIDNYSFYEVLKNELEKYYEVSVNTSYEQITLKPLEEDKYSNIIDHYPIIDECIYNFLSSLQVVMDYISDRISQEPDKAYAYRIRTAYEQILNKTISCSCLYQLINIDKDTLILTF